MTRTHLRRRMAALAVGAVALASTAGAAAAAASGAPAGPTAQSTAAAQAAKQAGADQAAAKQDPKQNPKPSPDPKTQAALAAAAKDLGVTVDQLNDALRATKIWFGTQRTDPTPETFSAHVGSILHVPAAEVLASFRAHGLFNDVPPGKPGPVKPGGGAGSANLDKAAKDLGVTRATLENALTQTKIWIGTTGAQPTPEEFATHVASVLGKNAEQVLKVLEGDGVLDATPPAKTRPLG